MADREMNGREQLEHHLLTWLSEDERPSIQGRAGMITSVIMEALDSWIEEHQPQEEEIKVGDRVRLKRKLAKDDGSSTDIVCTVVPPMDNLEAGSIGKVKDTGEKDGELRVDFPEIPSEWFFHVHDLEKVQP